MPKSFIELCAGTGALSVRLQGGHGRRPPISRMGNKAGYADVILDVLGLYPGQGADQYIWCDPDPGCRALLSAYPRPRIMSAVSDQILEWSQEDDPRALWERLKSAGPVHVDNLVLVRRDGSGEGLPDVESIARWICLSNLQQAGVPIRWARGRWESRKGTGTGWGACSCRWRVDGTKHDADHTRVDSPCARLGSLGAFEARIYASADLVEPHADAIVYIDPPYVGTTGYDTDLPRSEVVRIARAWRDAGALVCISEAEPIPELVEDGWYGVEVTGDRMGGARTFSVQQREFLTLSSPPASQDSVLSLFGS